MREEISFWAAVGFIAIASIVLFKVAAESDLGARIPGLRPLAEFV